MFLLYNISAHAYDPWQIYTGGAGEGAGFLKARCTAIANANLVFEG